MHLPANAAELRSLIDVALGREKADLAVLNGDLVNVHTGELLKNWAVAVKGRWIAYVGNDAAHTVGPETLVIDASGKTLIPGLIDAHTHLLWYYNLDEFIKHAVRGGTTTVVTETLELAYPWGSRGVVDFMQAAQGQPIKIFGTAPCMCTISPTAEAHAMDIRALKELLEREDILGLGEAYWSIVTGGNERVLELFAETLASGKKLEGHSAGARANKLTSYLSCGISSCHESTTADEALERMRLGVYAMIREGDVRLELPEISRIKDEAVDFRRLVLTTDGIGPKRLLNEGYMDFVLQRAINFGFNPITAVQSATLNAAQHFSLDAFIGSITPGRCADIVIIPDPKTIAAEYVISNGRVVARDGEVLVPPSKVELPRRSFRSIEIDRALVPADFSIPVWRRTGTVTVRVMDLVSDLVSREARLDAPITGNEIRIDVGRDILKIAVITTDDGEEKIFTGLVRGFGIRRGALATTAGWDTCAITVIGANELDMAEAVNRVIALEGGIVVSAGGEVLAEMALPIAGVISDLPMAAIVERLDLIKRTLRELGCPLPDPHLTLTVFTSPAIPFLRITEAGLVDIRTGETVDLVI